MNDNYKQSASSLWRKLRSNYIVRNVVLAISLLVIVIFVTNLFLNVFTRHNRHIDVPDFVDMSFREARRAAGHKLILEINDSLYVAHVAPGTILEQRPAAGTAVKPGRRVYVTINSSQQKITDVPYVTGYSLRQAVNILETAGLGIEKLHYVDDIATNNVLEQRVDGKVVKSSNSVKAPVGSGVTLTVGKSPQGATVVVPRVVGLPLRDACNRLWEAGINIRNIAHDDNVDQTNMTRARVYKQSPEQGRRVELGTYATISLSLDSVTVAGGVATSDRSGNATAVRERKLRDSLASEGFSGDELQEELDWILKIENGDASPEERRRRIENEIIKSLENSEYDEVLPADDDFFE